MSEIATSRLSHLERRLFFTLQKFAENKQTKHAHSKPVHLITGERGEDEAYFYLQSRGYPVVARRWTSGRLRGDLDLVAWDGDALVIFEVKTRTARDFATAESGVDRDKQRVLRRMANAYLRQFPERHRERVLVRFDVLSVYLLDSGTQIEHFRSAFGRNDFEF